MAGSGKWTLPIYRYDLIEGKAVVFTAEVQAGGWEMAEILGEKEAQKAGHTTLFRKSRVQVVRGLKSEW